MKDAPAQSEIVGELQSITGVLELHPKGYGFLRMAKNDYAAEDSDAFVSSSLIEKHRLREGSRSSAKPAWAPAVRACDWSRTRRSTTALPKSTSRSRTSMI